MAELDSTTIYGSLTVTNGALVSAGIDISGNLIMDGTTTDDKRLKLPYLSTLPTSSDNGSIWMESDGLHIYSNNAEATLSSGGGDVISVFTRTGVVGAESGDYTQNLITNLTTTDSPTFVGLTLTGSILVSPSGSKGLEISGATTTWANYIKFNGTNVIDIGVGNSTHSITAIRDKFYIYDGGAVFTADTTSIISIKNHDFLAGIDVTGAITSTGGITVTNAGYTQFILSRTSSNNGHAIVWKNTYTDGVSLLTGDNTGFRIIQQYDSGAGGTRPTTPTPILFEKFNQTGSVYTTMFEFDMVSGRIIIDDLANNTDTRVFYANIPSGGTTGRIMSEIGINSGGVLEQVVLDSGASTYHGLPAGYSGLVSKWGEFGISTGASGTGLLAFWIDTDKTITSIGNHNFLAGIDVTGNIKATANITAMGGNGWQYFMGYNGASSYRHGIYSTHNGSNAAGNYLDFYIWKYGTDAIGDVPTEKVFTISGTVLTSRLKHDFLAGIDVTGLIDTSGTGIDLQLNSYKANEEGHGIFFRTGYTYASNPMNVAIITHDFGSANTSPDGLIISGYDGVAIHTGSNTYDANKLWFKVSTSGVITINNLTASYIVETNGSKQLVSAAKGSAYNKAFGTGSSQVAEGNHSHGFGTHYAWYSSGTGSATFSSGQNGNQDITYRTVATYRGARKTSTFNVTLLETSSGGSRTLYHNDGSGWTFCESHTHFPAESWTYDCTHTFQSNAHGANIQFRLYSANTFYTVTGHTHATYYNGYYTT